MKKETAELLKLHLEKKKFAFESSDLGIEFRHDFTDDEILELVQSEYGKTIAQPVDELFKVVVKNLLKQGIEYATNVADADKLSDL